MAAIEMRVFGIDKSPGVVPIPIENLLHGEVQL